MSDRPPPRRPSSLEMTAVIPREGISVRSVTNIPGPTIEQLADVERARRDAQEAVDTMVPCPACGGAGMVSPETAHAWHAEHPKPTE